MFIKAQKIRWEITRLFINRLGEEKIYTKCNISNLGDGPTLNLEKQKAAVRNINKSLNFSGQVSQSRKKYLFSISNINFLSYAYSNLSNTFLVTMSVELLTLIIPNEDTKVLVKKKVNILLIQE
tara:strand:- start:59 stop:430 length:372 start_codon:yes stop_codon:yes gene_type:complete